jgi:hypothetical protein
MGMTRIPCYGVRYYVSQLVLGTQGALPTWQVDHPHTPYLYHHLHSVLCAYCFRLDVQPATFLTAISEKQSMI